VTRNVYWKGNLDYCHSE